MAAQTTGKTVCIKNPKPPSAFLPLVVRQQKTMNIKTKILLGLGFLFSVILLLGGLGAYYLDQLSTDAVVILRDNYHSLEYVRDMRQAMGDKAQKVEDYPKFQQNLRLQEKNVTEVGEAEPTNNLRAEFERHQRDTSLSVTEINRLLNQIRDVNMQAIVRKNGEAEATANRVKNYMILIATICALVAFSFIVNFPGYIANPIRELTGSIKQIANRNYEQRLDFKSGGEFGELAAAFNDMAERLYAYEHSNLAQLTFEKQRIETIIANLKDAIIGLDENNRILFLNPAMEQITGLDQQGNVGKYAPDVALHNDLLRSLLQAPQPEFTSPPFRGGAGAGASALKIFADNKESYFTKDVLDVYLPRNQQSAENGAATTAGKVIILKNITRFQELDLAKTNFIATISHELKTPIAAIKMSLKLLANEKVGLMNDEQKQLVGHIGEDSDRLLKITGELLDLSQVESGNIQLDVQPVPPREIVDLAIQAVHFQAEQRRVALETHLPETLPPVSADLEKTAWVLVNLLSNAIRYSAEDGKVTVSVTLDNETVGISVQDFGRGIDPKFQSRIFDKFFQVPNRDGHKSGTGLGLAIAKDFITAQGGTIGLESEPGKGSVFSFSLKIHKQA